MFTSTDEDKMSELGFRRPPVRYDVEAATSSPRLSVRISRRGRIILALGSLVLCAYFLYPSRDVLRPHKPSYLAEGDTDYFIVDEYGDHYYPNYPLDIAPMHPPKESLVDPRTLFTEVDATWLKPPKTRPFPKDKMREIVGPAPEEVAVSGAVEMPADAYSQTWVGPEDWNIAGPGVEKVQWEGFEEEYETQEEWRERVDRRDAVKRGFLYAWQKYKDVAWGHDEVKPVSGAVSDPFNNWGASIVDTLDTLLLMGLEDEYNLCRPHVNQLNLHWVSGRDWSQGYVAPDNESDDKGIPWSIGRDRTATIPVFETGIRYLGGLLGAYDLSGDELMLERAVDVASILKRAFQTRSGLPQGARYDPGWEGGLLTVYSVSAAEVGSMSLELIRLGRLTGDRQWFDLAQRVTDYLEAQVAPRSAHPPLIPMHFSPDVDAVADGSFSFGAMADSYYEYLIKAYKLLEGGPLAEPYKRLYTQSIDTARKLLFKTIDTIPGRGLFTIGKFEFKKLSAQTEHLACFAGGMLALGAKLLDRPQDMHDGKRFTETCYWISAATRTGIQPENVWYAEKNERYAVLNYTLDGRIAHPPAHTFNMTILDFHQLYRDAQGTVRFYDDLSPVSEDSGRNGKPLKYYSGFAGNPVGTNKVSGFYINRPETIESVFYMYRLTGDKKWQEKGWKMFTNWMEHAKVEHGISSIRDVTAFPDKLMHGDNMESFIFAETFKYHYLLHAEPDVMSLDDYVLNTEAHPLLANGKEPGYQRLWTDPKQDLGVRGEGTDAQKWLRHNNLAVFRRRHQALKGAAPPRPPPGGSGPPRWGKGAPVPGRGGGGGMGGGGGDPNYKPQPGD